MKKDKKPDRKLRIFAIVMLLLGIGLIVLKGFMPEYMDIDGVLHEDYFFLLPLGFLCIFCSILSWIIIGIKGIIRKRKSRKQ